MASQVAAVLVATSSGRGLAGELKNADQYTNLIEGPDGVPKCLLGVNTQPVLNHWLQSISQCPRLLPVKDKVFVLCNETNAEEVRAWAAEPRLSGGLLSPDNVLTNGSEDSLGLAADLAELLARLEAQGRGLPAGGCSLLVAEADCLCGPGFAVSRLVEHAAVRGRDTLGYTAAPAGMALEGQAVLGLANPAGAVTSASEPVIGYDPVPGGLVSGAELVAVLAPVAVFTPDTLRRVQLAAAAGGPPAVGGGLLGGLLAALLLLEGEGEAAQQTAPMFGMPVDCCFRLSDAYNVALTSNFYAYYATEKSGAKGEAAKALEAARRLAALNEARTLVGGSLSAAVKLLAEQEANQPPEPCVDGAVRKIFRSFWGAWLRGDRHYDTGAAVGRGGVAPLGMSRGGGGSGALPLRFADATTRRHAPKAQHPVYATTNGLYGIKAPTQLDMPLLYAGTPQTFTKSFPVSAPKNSAMVTAVTRSKVHALLDDF